MITALATAILADQPIARLLVLHPDTVVREGAFWQPLTAAFIFREGEVGGLLFTLVAQWFIGSQLEGFWGTKRYLVLVLGCGIGAYVASMALGLLIPAIAAVPVAGSTPIDVAAVVAFGVVFGRQPLQLLGLFPLSARGIAILVAVVAIVSPLARGAPWPEVLPLTTSMLAAILVTTQPWRRPRKSGRVSRGRRRGKPSHLKVVGRDDTLLN